MGNFSTYVGLDVHKDSIDGPSRQSGSAWCWESCSNRINHNDGGRGVYFEDPDGHLLEIITRPYASGGQRS
jgi:catechol 2,3-dioxygenase-like lactoylglutathione lyase family enzyme